MSRIKELKEDPKNQVSIIDILEIVTPEKKSKYVDLLLRLMKSTPSLDEAKDDAVKSIISKFSFIKKEDLENFTPIQILVVKTFLFQFFEKESMEDYRTFCSLNELGYIEQSDLSSYKTMSELKAQKEQAEIKKMSKILENEVKRVFENDEWVIVRPITFNASKKYGANTKWCTTSENSDEHFKRYTSKGVLIYSINKRTGYKVATFCSLNNTEPEFSFWNQKDTKIEAFDCELPDDLLMLIRKECKDPNAVPNSRLKKN